MLSKKQKEEILYHEEKNARGLSPKELKDFLEIVKSEIFNWGQSKYDAWLQNSLKG